MAVDVRPRDKRDAGVGDDASEECRSGAQSGGGTYLKEDILPTGTVDRLDRGVRRRRQRTADLEDVLALAVEHEVACQLRRGVEFIDSGREYECAQVPSGQVGVHGEKREHPIGACGGGMGLACGRVGGMDFPRHDAGREPRGGRPRTHAKVAFDNGGAGAGYGRPPR